LVQVAGFDEPAWARLAAAAGAVALGAGAALRMRYPPLLLSLLELSIFVSALLQKRRRRRGGRPVRRPRHLLRVLAIYSAAALRQVTAAIVYLPPLQDIFGTAPLGWVELAVLLPFPVVVWGADEVRRWRRRRPDAGETTASGATLDG
jgi:hypothetical protein